MTVEEAWAKLWENAPRGTTEMEIEREGFRPLTVNRNTQIAEIIKWGAAGLVKRAALGDAEIDYIAGRLRAPRKPFLHAVESEPGGEDDETV